MREPTVDATSLLTDIAKLINDNAGARLAADKWINDNARRARQIAKYRQYVDGDQDTGISDDARKLLNLRNAEDDFNYNKCAQAIEEISDRIEAKAFIAMGDGVDAANEWANNLREWNWFDELQLDVNDAYFRDGDTYIMASFDPEADMVVWTHELAFDGSNGVLVVQNTYDRAVTDVAVKVWSEPHDKNQDKTRLNIYFPDRILKYVRIGTGQFTPFEVEGETDADLRWVGRDNQTPLGVPIIKFSRRATAKGGYGVSKLRNVIPLQHALNATLHSTVGAALLAAFTVNFAFGFPAPKEVAAGMFIGVYPRDKDGNPISPPTAESIEYLKAMRTEQLRGGDLTQHIEVLRFFKEGIGEVGNLPNTEYGANESGDAKEQRESRLIAEAKRAHVSLGGAYSRLLELSVYIQDTFSTKSRPKFLSAKWRTEWADARTRNDLRQAEILDKVAPHFEGTNVIMKKAAKLIEIEGEELDDIIAEKEAASQSTADAILSRLPGFARNGEGGATSSAAGNGRPGNNLLAANAQTTAG